MHRWKEEFTVHNQRKCVHVHSNGDFERAKILYMEADWSYLDFLNAASNRLDIVPAAKRVFNADGVEINDCMMIEDDDILFLSQGEDFQAPFDADRREDIGSKFEGDKLPHTIGGYRVGDVLGRGGFGEVRVGEHHLTDDRVALKFLRKSEIHSLNAAERTNTEIQCLTALRHSNIIRLHSQMESQNHVVLVFELMEGGDLMKFLIRRREITNGVRICLSEDEARHVFYQVLSAISYAHNQHICHRDLKLENILLKDNTLSHVKIADFGLSDFYRPGAMIKSNCGTLSFLAPEVFKGTANAGPPLDVWSMGVILFALVCGRLPFEGSDLLGTKRPRDSVIKSRIMKGQYKVDDSLSLELKDLLRRMLQGDPTERMTIPEIFNHIWIRTSSSSTFSVDPYPISTSSALASFGSSPVDSYMSTSLNSKSRRNSQQLSSKFEAPDPSFGGSPVASNKSVNFRHNVDDAHSSKKTDRSSPMQPLSRENSSALSDILDNTERMSALSIDEAAEAKSSSSLSSVAPLSTPAEAKSMIRLVPLRRNTSNKDFKDDDKSSFSSHEDSVPKWRPSTVASGARRSSIINEEEIYSSGIGGDSSSSNSTSRHSLGRKDGSAASGFISALASERDQLSGSKLGAAGGIGSSSSSYDPLKKIGLRGKDGNAAITSSSRLGPSYQSSKNSSGVDYQLGSMSPSIAPGSQSNKSPVNASIGSRPRSISNSSLGTSSTTAAAGLSSVAGSNASVRSRFA